MRNNAFLGSELAPRAARECRFHVIPVPYEDTVSYGKGASGGPAAILEASQQLEVWTGRSMPSEQGIYTWPSVVCSGGIGDVLENIEALVSAVLVAGPQGALPLMCSAANSGIRECFGAPVLPVVLGGEHTVTLGTLRALQKRYGHFGVIQCDAHADLRDSYEGTPYSHACVMRRAVDDLGLSLFQVGARSMSSEEAVFRKERGIGHLDSRVAGFPLSGREGGANADVCSAPSLLPCDFPGKVFLTFDVDAFDSSLMPATGTPEPGGLFWWDALHLVERCLIGRILLGFDVVELAPIPGMHAPDYTAARLAYEIMGLIAEGK
ncbi:MAG: agmatinase [Desulfovibrio sp.]|jgi:agmatinase|nr:agmatinase [Desulfovibrio sp.]